MAEDGPKTRSFHNNDPTTAMNDREDEMENRRPNGNNNNSSTCATTTVRNHPVDVMTENTTSTSNHYNQGHKADNS
jgi:hypothetical protein